MQFTLDPYDFISWPFKGRGKIRLFQRLGKNRFELFCFPEKSWARGRSVRFRGRIKPTATGSRIIGTFYLRKDNLISDLLCTTVLVPALFSHNRAFAAAVFLIYACMVVIIHLSTLPDPALEKHVLDYINDNLLGPAQRKKEETEGINGSGELEKPDEIIHPLKSESQ